MKHIFTILLIFVSCSVFAQFQRVHHVSDANTKEAFDGSVNPIKGMINGRYKDTLTANYDKIAGEPGAQIIVGNTVYLRDSTATKWLKGFGAGSSSSQVSILNDSSLTICNNSSGCDTIIVHNLVVNNFTILNDSSILVCNGSNTCDTIHIAPTPITKPYVDSVKVNGHFLYYYINGVPHLSGIINVDSSVYITNTAIYHIIDSLSQATNTSIYNIIDSLASSTNSSLYNAIDSLAGTKIDNIFFSSSDIADTLEFTKGGVNYIVGIIDSKQGRIYGCNVYYISGLTYGITSGVYKIGTIRYNYPGGTVTLPPADATYTMRDDIALDSTGAIVVPGIPSANPASPQLTGEQIELIEVQVNPNDTIPAGPPTSPIIYDEHVSPEWTFTSFGLTVNPDNTASPFHLTKDIYVSAGSSGNYFQLANSTTLSSTDYSNLVFHIKMNGALNSKSNISVQFFNGPTNVSNSIILGGAYGFSKSITSYQSVVIPITAFNFSSATFDRVRFIYTGNSFQTFYVDYIQLQSGVPATGGGSGGTFTQIPSDWLEKDSTRPDYIKNKPDITAMIQTALAVPDTTHIISMGSGIRLFWANSTDTIFAKTIKPGAGITFTQNPDSSISVNSIATGTVLSVTGNPTALVDNTDPANPIIQQDVLKLDKSKLNGGNTGQALVKNSNTDQDYGWTTPAGSTNANIGVGNRLAVAFTNNIKTLFAISPILIDSTTNTNALTFTLDTTNHHTISYYNTIFGSLSQQNTNTTNITTNTTNIATNTTAIAGKLSNITGLVTAGTNVTLSGSGTSGSPYVVSSSGGGSSTIDQTLTATAGQTAFVFTSVPTRFLITINGTVYNNYTVSGATVTVGMTDILAGDKVRLFQTQ